MAFGGSERHLANSHRQFRTGYSDLLIARFGVRVSVPEPLSEYEIGKPASSRVLY
jgi:hypothetical protein